jgi:hypothetical protein
VYPEFIVIGISFAEGKMNFKLGNDLPSKLAKGTKEVP